MKHGRMTSSECSAASCSAGGGAPVPASTMTFERPAQCSRQARPLVVGCGRRSPRGISRTSSRMVDRQTGELGGTRGRRGQPVDDTRARSARPVPSAVGAVAAEIDERRRLTARRAQRQRAGDHRGARCRPSRPNTQSRDSPPTNDALRIGGSRRRNLSTPEPPCQRAMSVRSGSVAGGGVWAPGGLHRLQSGRDGRSPSGGFDSRPPPPNSLWTECLGAPRWAIGG